MMSGKITALLVKYDNVIFYITLADTKANDTDVWIKKDDYELYHNVDDAFYNGLVCPEHMSTYNKTTMEIESQLPIGPKSGYFVEHVSQPLMGVDKKSICKAFKNSSELLYYKEKFPNSQIYSINEEETITTEVISPLDLNPSPTISLKKKIKDTLHILCVSKEENLTNGFLPIKELIYEIRDLKNYNTYKKLVDAKIKV